MKTAVVYYSRHHGNTKKVLDAIAQKFDITFIDASKTESADLGEYDLIGFASGIYYSSSIRASCNSRRKTCPVEEGLFYLHLWR